MLSKIGRIIISLGVLSSAALAEFGDARPVSIASDNTPANAASLNCALSTTGRYLSFTSAATNLTASANNGKKHVFLRDRLLLQTILVSAGSSGVQGADDSDFSVTKLNPDDSDVYVVYQSAAQNLTGSAISSGILLYNATTNSSQVLNAGFGEAGCSGGFFGCYYPDMSKNTRFVIYLSDMGSGTNLILLDRQSTSYTNLTSSVDSKIVTSAPAISDDGMVIALGSYASNLVAGDTNSRADVFVYDRNSSSWEIVSIPPAGESWGSSEIPLTLGPGSISSDGRYVAFGVDVDDGIPDKVYIRDRIAGSTTRVGGDVPSGNDPTLGRSTSTLKISGDGLGRAFYSLAKNLNGVGDTEAYYYQRSGSSTSTSLYDHARGAFNTREVCISGDGKVVVVQASNDEQLYSKELDQCLSDPNKESPGVCGCGTEDIDSDEDGTFDCADSCPYDPNKTADSDSDGDHVLDCNDYCTADPYKVTTGSCGCGKPDLDLNGNKRVDCLESIVRSGSAPKVRVLGKGKIEVTMTQQPGAKYEITTQRSGGSAVLRTVTKNKVTITNFSKGSYKITYRIVVQVGIKKYRGPISKAGVFKID